MPPAPQRLRVLCAPTSAPSVLSLFSDRFFSLSLFRLSSLPLCVITSLLPLFSLKPRCPPNHYPAAHQHPQTHETQNHRRPPMQIHLWHSRHPSEKHKHAGRRHNKNRIPH